MIYKVFQWTGYEGLIFLRCLVFLVTALLISRFFLNRDDGKAKILIGASVLIAFCLALTVRELLIRPHLFSYLFIVAFLYILEIRRSLIWLLPVLGIAWCNIHGIEYPVMILILLSYLLEMYYRDLRKSPGFPSGTKKDKWIIIATLYTVFLTPQFIELIKTPFTVTYANSPYQHLYISELMPLAFNNIFQFSVLPLSNLIGTFHNILIIAPFIALIICLWKRSVRVSHIILWVASLILLIKHNRFAYEFILLSIPIVRHSIGLLVKSPEDLRRRITPITAVAMIIILVVLPFSIYKSHFKNKPEYPLSQISLPVGIAGFLNRMDADGKVLNEPNTGGYMQWALNKKYKIFMDMQLSLFSDLDFAYVNHALHDENTFQTFIGQYDPSFISVSLSRSTFNEFIGHYPQYKQIFFDDAEVLYVNKTHYPEIAKQYELKAINPFGHDQLKFEKESKERVTIILNEAMRISELHPGCGIANSMIARILIMNRRYEEASIYADKVIQHYPNIAKGYVLKGDALRGQERVEEAISSYLIAIRRGLKPDEFKVYWSLHTCYGHLKMYKKAYLAISKFVNPFDTEASYRDIYALGISAALAGKSKDAVNFLKIAQSKLPADDDEYQKKIKEHLMILKHH
jgi:tetratricopeptide (TPR) repeat protein